MQAVCSSLTWTPVNADAARGKILLIWSIVIRHRQCNPCAGLQMVRSKVLDLTRQNNATPQGRLFELKDWGCPKHWRTSTVAGGEYWCDWQPPWSFDRNSSDPIEFSAIPIQNHWKSKLISIQFSQSAVHLPSQSFLPHPLHLPYSKLHINAMTLTLLTGCLYSGESWRRQSLLCVDTLTWFHLEPRREPCLLFATNTVALSMDICRCCLLTQNRSKLKRESVCWPHLTGWEPDFGCIWFPRLSLATIALRTEVVQAMEYFDFHLL